MDRMIYIAMSGAKQALEQQASVSSNMANASTVGFRAQLHNFRAVPVVGTEAATRTFVVASTPGADLRRGPMVETGRALDVAVQADGWITIQMPDGSEGYTKAGNLQIGGDGQLLTMDRRPVIGDAGPVVVPPAASIGVDRNGVVTARGVGAAPGGAAEVGRLKLVNPPAADLVRVDDGVFRVRAGVPAPQADRNVTLLTGMLEGSNVNPVEAMIGMISNARRFDMQMKALQTADNNEQSANQLLSHG